MSASFDTRLARAVEILHELRGLEHPDAMRLSAKGFVAAACKTANCTPDRLKEVEATLDQGYGRDAAKRFVRQVLLVYKQQPQAIPAKDCDKMLRAFGTEDSARQLHDAGIRVSEACALAALYMAQRFPERFGQCEDHEAWKAKVTALRADLDKQLEAIRTSWTAADVIFDADAVTVSERDRGLVRLRFRKADISPVGDDWPLRLVTAMLTLNDAMAEQKGAA